MKYIKIVALVATLSFFFSSCEKDWLEVNDNPNAATEVGAEYLFGYAITSWSGNRTGGDSFLPIGLMNQTIASGGDFGWGFGADRYDISPYSLGNTWKLYYATSGANIKQAITIAEKAKKGNAAAQCKIVLAALMYECTMIYGDIPYSEAWTEKTEPKFDAQKDVLNGLLSLLDEAIAQIKVDAPASSKIITEDLYYNGDMNSWKALANSLKLKIAMVMVDKDKSKAALIGSLIKKKLITESNLNVEFPYYDESGHKNPKYRLIEKYNGGKQEWLFADDVILEGMMKPYNDPRIEKFYTKGKKGGAYKGAPTATTVDDTYSLIKVGYKPDTPDLIISSQEINFLIAEAYLRGLGVAKDKAKADEFFKTGLRQALAYYDVDDASINTFISQASLDLKTVANPLKVLHTEQYIDLVDRSLEAWVQARRSGKEGDETPNLKTPKGAQGVPAGKIARRWVYPPDELTGNSNAPKNIPKIYENMWFDE